MLERPDILDCALAAALQQAYGVTATQVTFLPLGADMATVVYRVVAKDGTPYFLKLRRGVFDRTSVLLPRFLRDQGIEQIIAPLATLDGDLWVDWDTYTVILYPFVEGQNGFHVVLSERHWYEFGQALKRLHTLTVPASLLGPVRRESYAPRWRETVMGFLERVADDDLPRPDPVAEELAAFLGDKHDETLDLVTRADRLAREVEARSPACVLCHSDAHAGNILVDAGGALYIVDWDDPILAPKERDLMFIGGAQGFLGRTPEEEKVLFYRGYGPVEIDTAAQAYYRYERIVVDIGIYCEQIFLTGEGGADREQSLMHLKSNYKPGGTIDTAYRSE